MSNTFYSLKELFLRPTCATTDLSLSIFVCCMDCRWYFWWFFFLWRVFSDGDCGSKEDPCINYIRNASRRGQLSDQTFAAGFLRISDNDTMPSPVRLFHWDTYSMYGAGQEYEFPVYLLDVNGFSVNVFVQIETTAPLPSKRRSKKRSSKKASERRLSKQASVSDR